MLKKTEKKLQWPNPNSTSNVEEPNCFSLSLTSGLWSVAKIRKELMATDKKGRRGRQTVKADRKTCLAKGDDNFSTGKSPGEKCFSLSLTSDLSSVAKKRKEFRATDKKGRRGRQT